MKAGRKIVIRGICLAIILMWGPTAVAYEVVVGLGSTADKSVTAAMVDRSKWPVVANLSWGPHANLAPIVLLEKSQQQLIFDNFKQRHAIAEIPFRQIKWTGIQPAIPYIESFGFSVPYLFVPDGSAGDSMLTRNELLRLKARFPDKKIIMNTYSWLHDHVHVQSVQDVLDGVCIEYFPHNARSNIVTHVAPFAEWAYTNDKVLMFLMPPLPDEDRFAYYATQMARIVHEENSDRLPKGWMKSDKFIFSPANYTFGESTLTYVPEDSGNTVLGAAKALLLLRPDLDAEPEPSNAAGGAINSILLIK